MGSKKEFGAAEIAGIGIGLGAGIIGPMVRNQKLAALADQKADAKVVVGILENKDIEKTKVLLESFARFKELKREKEAKERQDRINRGVATITFFLDGISSVLNPSASRLEKRREQEEARKKAAREKRFGWLKRILRIS